MLWTVWSKQILSKRLKPCELIVGSRIKSGREFQTGELVTCESIRETVKCDAKIRQSASRLRLAKCRRVIEMKTRWQERLGFSNCTASQSHQVQLITNRCPRYECHVLTYIDPLHVSTKHYLCTRYGWTEWCDDTTPWLVEKHHEYLYP